MNEIAARLRLWTDQIIDPDALPALLAIYAITFAGLRLGARRRLVIGVASGACALAFSIAWTLIVAAWIAVFHRVALARVHGAWKVAFLCLSFLATLFACDAALFPALQARYPWIHAYAWMFYANLLFRTFYYLHEMHVRRWAPSPLGDLYLYLGFAPFFVIVPYMLAIPRFSTFVKGLDAPRAEVPASGLRLIAWGVALILAHEALVALYDTRAALAAALRGGEWAVAAVAGLAEYPVHNFLEIIGPTCILIGLVRGLGIDLGLPFQNPLAATSVLDWWRRWNTHFRELLVDIFYYPVVMRLRRRGPYLPLVAGAASVFLVGSTVFHMKGSFQFASHARLQVGVLVENVLMFVIVAAALCWERRRKLPARRTIWRDAVGRARTYVTLCAVVLFAGHGTMYLVYDRPAEQAVAAPRVAAEDVEWLRDVLWRRPKDPALRLRLAEALRASPDPADREEALAQEEWALAFGASLTP